MSIPVDFYHQKAKFTFRSWDDLFNYSKTKISSKDTFNCLLKKYNHIFRQAQTDLHLIKYLINQKIPIGLEPPLGTSIWNTISGKSDQIKYIKLIMLKTRVTNPAYVINKKNEDIIPMCFQDISSVVGFIKALGTSKATGKHTYNYVAYQGDYIMEPGSKLIRITNSHNLKEAFDYYSKGGKNTVYEAKKPSAPPREKVEKLKKPRKTKTKSGGSSHGDSDSDSDTDNIFKVPSRTTKPSNKSSRNYNSFRPTTSSYVDDIYSRDFH